MKSLKTFVVFTLLLLGALSNATNQGTGSYTLTAESNGTVSLAWNDKHRELIYNLLARTGDFSPGYMLVRLDNMPVYESDGSSYWGSIHIPEEGDIPVLDGKKLRIPNIKQPNAKAIHVDHNWFMVKHQIEVLVYGLNGKGQINTNHSTWPAVQFTLEPTESPAAAQTNSGQTITANQLEAAIKLAYNQGRDDTLKSGSGDRDQLLQKIKELVDQNNKLELELAKKSSSSPIKLCRYLPIAWTCHEPVPTLRENLVVYLNGRPEASASVVEVVTIGSGRDQYYRVWVKMEISSDVDLDHCTVGRSKPQGGN